MRGVATRSRYIFVMPLEIVEWVRDVSTSPRDRVVLDRGRGQPPEPWDGAARSLLSACRIFFSGDLARPESASSAEIVPAMLGWVQLGVPRTQGSSLFSVRLMARADWLDPARNEIMQNQEPLLRFQRIWGRWKPRVIAPLLARNPSTGSSKVCPSYGYSVGAVDWVRRGGKLCEEERQDIEFVLPEEHG
jgi:hypothetical protein